MKRGKKLCILAGALVILCLAVWGITALTRQEATPMALASGEIILEVETGSVTELSWTYSGTEYTFLKEDGAWTYPADSAYTVDESYITAILETLTQVEANKVIEKPDDLKNYGLEEPVCTVRVAGKTLLFGDENTINGYRYFSQGDGKVYLLGSTVMTGFTYSLLEMAQKDPIPDLTQIQKIHITTETEEITLENLGENDLTYSSYYTWFVAENGGYTVAAQDVVDGLTIYLEDLSWQTCADYNMTAPETYGLDVPAATYEITYLEEDTEKTYTIQVGDAGDDGVFLTEKGSGRVYTVDSTTGQVLASMNRNGFTCVDVIRVDLAQVTSVDIALDGETYTLVKTLKEQTEAETTDGTQATEAEEYVWLLGEKEMDIAATLEGMSELEGTATEEAVEGLSRELTITFHRDAQTFPEVELVFYRLDGTNCLASLNGGAPVLVSRTDVVTLQEAFNSLFL